MTIRYAAYGSNLHPVRLAERLPSARLVGSGHVPGYGLNFSKRSLDASGKCSINPGGAGLYVAIYEISAADKQRLDDIEGVGRGYSDEVIDVPGFSNCATYVAETSHIDSSLVPYDWYRELVLLGCRFHAFPAAYIAGIEALQTIVDPDAVRSDQNRQLIERIRSV